jgi:hypothetical protein
MADREAYDPSDEAARRYQEAIEYNHPVAAANAELTADRAKGYAKDARDGGR